MMYTYSNSILPLRYFTAGNLISKNGFLHEKRNFNDFVFILIKEGTLYLNQNGKEIALKENQFILLRANVEHFGYHTTEGNLSYLWVHFQFQEGTQTVDSLLENKNCYIIPEYGEISSSKRASILFHQLLDISRQENIYSSSMIDYALSLLMMEITQELLSNSATLPSPIIHITEWIKANYYLPLTVKDLANEFNYNADYLSTMFKKTMGQSIIQFINKVRIDSSKVLLMNFDISIKEIAYSCGFQDEKYYMKTFKKQVGMTPSQYKKAFEKKYINTKQNIHQM